MRERRTGREEAVLEAGSGLDVGGHDPRTATFNVAFMVTLCPDRDSYCRAESHSSSGGSLHAHTHTETEHMQTHTHEHTWRGGGTEERRQRWRVILSSAFEVTVRGP